MSSRDIENTIWYQGFLADQQADRCVECYECEEACPQEIAIVEWLKEAHEILPEGYTCPHCGGGSFTKEKDIMDVWFDSGSSHAAVLETRAELRWPAELYIEGSDQHRGWFQSSLLTAVAMHGSAPDNYMAALAYAQLWAYADAINAAGSTDEAAVMEQLETLTGRRLRPRKVGRKPKDR